MFGKSRQLACFSTNTHKQMTATTASHKNVFAQLLSPRGRTKSNTEAKSPTSMPPLLQEEETYKVVVLGDESVGKTSMSIHFLVHDYITSIQKKKHRYTLNTSLNVNMMELGMKKLKMEALEQGVRVFNTDPKQGNFKFFFHSNRDAFSCCQWSDYE